jgi:hypothetical protein
MAAGDRLLHEDRGIELAELLRRNIQELRAMRERDLDETARRRVDRLLAEAEATLSEIETPEEG